MFSSCIPPGYPGIRERINHWKLPTREASSVCARLKSSGIPMSMKSPVLINP